MAKRIKELLEDTEKLNKENATLQRRLREAEETIDLIKTGNIDALVVADKKDLKVYTETTADKTYRILIEKMHEGAVTLNKDGTILYCNSSFANMVTLPQQKVTGTKFKNFITASLKSKFDVIFKQGWKSYSQNEVNLYTSHEKEIPVLMSLNTISLDNKFVLSIILTDLTIRNRNQEELKRRTRQLEQINEEMEVANKELAFQSVEKEKRAAELSIAIKDLTTFTYLSSHDLQEPLRKIKNFVSLLLEEENNKLSPEGKIYLQRMYETAKGMNDLIEDLLTYVGTKNTERNFIKTDLTIIINEVKKEFEEVIAEKKATFEVAPLCKTSIIQFQFRQLIQNLISNSLKFSKPKIAPHIKINSEIKKGSKLNKPELSLEIDYCHII